MGVNISKDVPELKYVWTYRAKNFYKDTVPVVSGDGKTVALYSRGEKLIHVLDGDGSHLCSIKMKQKMLLANVSAIPSLSYDGSRIVTRDSNSVICYTRTGELMWEYERSDKVVRSGMQSWIAQISANGKIVVVRMFHDLIWINADNGEVISIATHEHEYARTIPRISDDGSTVIVADGFNLLCYVNATCVWTKPAEKVKGKLHLYGWGDPGLSADGRVCSSTFDHVVHIFDTKTGNPVGTITDVRSVAHENSSQASFSADGKIIAVVLQKNGIGVFTGPGYQNPLLLYTMEGVHRPVAPLLTRDGKRLLSKAADTILQFDIGSGDEPVAVGRVKDTSHIPGGPTVHSRDYHHDRDTHHIRTYTVSDDGSFGVTVAKSKELWAFKLGSAQGGVIGK